MPFISVICPTMRVGGLDILFDSLQKQTFTDFELVLVDGLYERRKELVYKEARDRFLAVRHVGLTPNPFPIAAFCRYANAGIIASTGEILLFIVDYSELPPDLLAKHAAFHKANAGKKLGLMSPHKYVHFQADPNFPRYNRDSVDQYERDVKNGALDKFMWSAGKADHETYPVPHDADGGAKVEWNADPKLALQPGPIEPCFFHAKNESVPRAVVLEVNGWDQDLDGAHLYQDSDFADRLTVKAGLKWQLDPSNVINIVNPRHVFPFARRLRPHESNKEIWEKKKAAGYPALPELYKVPVKIEGERLTNASAKKAIEQEVTQMMKAKTTDKPCKIAMVYGAFSSAIHGPFDIHGLYTRVGLTGSESSFFNLARGLSKIGHQVAVICDCEGIFELSPNLTVFPFDVLQKAHEIDFDVAIAWNEPDYLSFFPQAKKFCDQQLNDFDYCRHPQWFDLADVWVSPSENHRQNVINTSRIPAGKRTEVIPNSVDLTLFDEEISFGKRNEHRVVYCSSPDRGLHHLLSMWPHIRRQVPDAELKIFYRLEPWLARARGNDDEVGKRARYIETVLPLLKNMGVTVAGPVPNLEMMRELQQAKVLAYPCDPVRYTEGFGCSVLDAATAGCYPVIHDVDALGEVHGKAAYSIKNLNYGEWVSVIAGLLKSEISTELKQRMVDHAINHDVEKITDRWDQLIRLTLQN